MSDQPNRKTPAIPPREPQGEADWSVIVRHSPLKFRKAVVKAKGKEQAWQKFLTEADAKTTPEAFRADGRKEGAKHFQSAREWLAAAKLTMPEGVEVIGADYVKARLQALRVKGTVSVEQIGFPELASV